MKNNKGFTLIELIGVLIIMSLLIMIVFPATVRLMRDNDERKFDYYYDIVLKGADSYAALRRDELGGINDEGCVDDITLSTLIKYNKVKKFDDKSIVCGTPSEFTAENGRPDLYTDLGIAGSYIDVRLTNNKGKVKSEASLICVKGRKVVYQKLISKMETCSKYVAVAPNVLYDSISTLASSTTDNVNYYLTGAVTNNYVWYSGKLWRVVSYNKNEKTIKLVTDSAVSTLTYNVDNISSNSNYVNSNMSVWLNNKFLSTLNNPNLYLVDALWNYTTVADATLPANTDTTRGKVGLLNYYEYNMGKDFLGINQNWWLLSKQNSNSVWYVNSANGVQSGYVGNFLGVRPSIVLKSNVTYYSGADGSKTSPYRLSGESSANPGAFLNSRFVGEYVSYGGLNFRISEISDQYVRLISTSNLTSTVPFDSSYSRYSLSSLLADYLLNVWLVSATSPHQSLAVNADFCTATLDATMPLTAECPTTDGIMVASKVGVPKIGDMFTSGVSSGTYWTVSPYDNQSINVVNPDNTVRSKPFFDIYENETDKIKDSSDASRDAIDIRYEDFFGYVRFGVRPVVNVSPKAKITGGNGTFNNPYVIGYY